jgi:acyl-CoA thioesterase-1
MRYLELTLFLCMWGAGCGPSEPSRGGEDPAGGQEIPLAAPEAVAPEPGRPVVVFLGTSLTVGLGLSRAEETYVARLTELGDSAGVPFRAVNAGVSGDTSAGGLRRLDWVLQEPLDVLVVELGANDGLRGQDPAATADNLRAIVDRARARYPDVRIVLAGMEAPPNLGSDYTRRFRSVFGAVAAEKGTGLVPFLLEGVAGVPDLNQDDGIHPTAEGHRRMAYTVWPALEPVLRDWAAQSPLPEEGR